MPDLEKISKQYSGTLRDEHLAVSITSHIVDIFRGAIKCCNNLLNKIPEAQLEIADPLLKDFRAFDKQHKNVICEAALTNGKQVRGEYLGHEYDDSARKLYIQIGNQKYSLGQMTSFRIPVMLTEEDNASRKDETQLLVIKNSVSKIKTTKDNSGLLKAD